MDLTKIKFSIFVKIITFIMFTSFSTLLSGTNASSTYNGCDNPFVSDLNFMYPYQNLSLSDMDNEIWQPIIDTIDFKARYYVSNMGRIKSFFSGEPKIMKQQLSKTNGRYLLISFQDIKVYTRSVHRIVAKVFILNTENLPEVNHKWGDKLDNRASELEWSTHSNNIKHASEILDVNGGLKHFRSKFKEQDIIDIFYSKNTNRELSKKYGVSSGVICSIKNKKSYKSILKKHSIKGRIFNSQKGLTEKDVLAIYSSKLTYKNISQLFKIGEGMVYSIKSGKIYSSITGGKRNTNCANNTKLSKEDVVFIRDTSLGTTELSIKYGVSKSTIKAVKNKKTFKWI